MQFFQVMSETYNFRKYYKIQKHKQQTWILTGFMVWPKHEENIYIKYKEEHCSPPTPTLISNHCSPPTPTLISNQVWRTQGRTEHLSVYLLPGGETFESDTVEVFFLSVQTTPLQNCQIYWNLPV